LPLRPCADLEHLARAPSENSRAIDFRLWPFSAEAIAMFDIRDWVKNGHNGDGTETSLMTHLGHAANGGVG
jgi:hypothetical protein